MYPEFEAAAFALQPEEISPVIETEAGYHIIKQIKRKGEYVNVRHILIQTKVSPLSVKKAQKFMDSVYNLVISGKMTFEDAARKFSTDNYSGSGGMAINPNTGNNIFQPAEIDKDVFFQLDKLDAGQVSKPFVVRNDKNKMVIKIVKLQQRTAPHKASLKTDYDKIQEAALRKKKADAVAKWINERTADTYIIILDEDFKKCNFMYNWM
jgi:peptidyl-prolyl cis-trans isomerase SurA